MAQFDLPLERLVEYLPDRDEPADFDEFWQRTLSEQDTAHPLVVKAQPQETGLTLIETHDVTFTGFGGQDIKGWWHRPAGVAGDLGVVVEYTGYGNGRGLPIEHTLLAQAGYGVLVMDNRGQGAEHGVGHTGDAGTTGPHTPGFLTRGVESPQTYYYRRLFTDAVRAVEAVRELPGADVGRVVVMGGSQGGATALASAALCGLRGFAVQGVIAAVPFLTHVRRATEITDAPPYDELVRFLATHRDLVEQTFRTISYVDGVNFAARVQAPGLFSVGLRDSICPPSSVYAAYNHYAGEKQMKVYSYNGHEHGGVFQWTEFVWFAHRMLGWAAAHNVTTR